MRSGENNKRNAHPLLALTMHDRQPDPCSRCEALLVDAVDGLLEPEDQAWFDRHTADCTECQEALAEATRGAAWLEVLKTPRPEPSAGLLERILAQTSGQDLEAVEEVSAAEALPSFAPATLPVPARVLPFRTPAAPHWSRPRGLSRLLFEPRLAMTAAMAFFSIALTMNMAGVRLNELHASDLRPGNLRHTWYEATAAASRRYESLRVVQVLESRVDDLNAMRDSDAGSGASSSNPSGGSSSRSQ